MTTLASVPLRTRLLLLRHGPVDWTRAGEDGPPLSTAGVREAELAASTLASFDVVVAGPALACAQTAEIISARRGVALTARDDLDEIRAVSSPRTPAAYSDWLDSVFLVAGGSDHGGAAGESLDEGVARFTAALRAIGDRYYGRSILVVSHPVILTGFRASLLQRAAQREYVDGMPDLAHASVDYFEGRFYLVADFPLRFWTPAEGRSARPSTFSIAACDAATGEVGVAVASKFLAVGAVVPWARAGAGAIATQAWANVSFGPGGLALLAEGRWAQDVLDHLTRGDEGREHRQVGVVDAAGRAAGWTGRECIPWAGHATGKGFSCQGNILRGAGVVDAMAAAFEQVSGPLPERLLAALSAGQAAGGDSRGQQSAALYVARDKGSYGGYIDRYIDLRVDDHAAPIDELRRLLELHRLYFGPTNAAHRTRLAGNVARMVQEALAKAGFYGGPIDGVYGAQTKDAFRRWVGVENFEERWRDDEFVDREILAYMRKRYGVG